MCDTLVVVQPGRVLFAKNSDRDPNEAQMLEWHARQSHPEGASVHCTWIAIPQVRHTNAVLISRPFWMWGAEMGANEHGVVIGNEAVFTRQPRAKSGLTGMDLLRLALERSNDAASAVRVIVELLETYGQGGGCGHENRRFTYHNSFLVADPSRAIVLETAGKFWATEEVRGGRSISNSLTIAGFAERHSNRLRTWISGAARRGSRTMCLAQSAQTADDLAMILRDHGEGNPFPRYSLVNGGLNAPCAHAAGLMAGSQTAGSWISEMSADHVRHWATGTAAPCCSLYKPVRVGEPIEIGPVPTDRADEISLWWRGERLHRQIIRAPEHWLPRLSADRESIEREWFADPPPSQGAFQTAHQWTNRWTELAQSEVQVGNHSDTRPAFVRRYWRSRNRRAGLQWPHGVEHRAACTADNNYPASPARN